MSTLYPIPATEDVLQHLPDYLQALNRTETARAQAGRTDGVIIGTGAADFTKGNTRYRLQVADQVFELLDVPGIEGDESRYIEEVKKAVATAHLIIYVNGTNKKPEKQTAHKIGSYLKRGTQVLPVINLRGNADAYEFSEDRIDLLQHAGADSALQQTTDVLASALDAKVLLPGQVVQGLLAFSSLAINQDGSTSIDPSRNNDLVVQQRNYRKYFTSAQEMTRFSRIEGLANVVHGKLDSWREDIVESNKTQVTQLLSDYLVILDEQLALQDTFMRKAQPEFEKCRVAFAAAITGFEDKVKKHWDHGWNDFFSELTEVSDGIVEQHFGDEDEITRHIMAAFKQLRTQTDNKIRDDTANDIAQLQQQLEHALLRLQQDIHNVEFQQKMTVTPGASWRLDTEFAFESEFDIGELGGMAMKIGSYIVSGMLIGSLFPGPGNIIGGVIGGIFGAVMSVVSVFLGREKKVRKAKALVHSKINSMNDEVLASIPAEISNLVNSIREQIDIELLQRVDAIQAALHEPKIILNKQKKLIGQIQSQLEKMPYGCLNAIQY
ncbi:DUF1269 domain-containing protein [Erwiniaceae bacterium L1_54_6]|nr:DUF1269 domain-containing protein [Erwiniaceae bacterium L1_54_6]